MLSLIGASAHDLAERLQFFGTQMPVAPPTGNLPHAMSRIGFDQLHSARMPEKRSQRRNCA